RHRGAFLSVRTQSGVNRASVEFAGFRESPVVGLGERLLGESAVIVPAFGVFLEFMRHSGFVVLQERDQIELIVQVRRAETVGGGVVSGWFSLGEVVDTEIGAAKV